MNLAQISIYLILAFILYLILNYCKKFEEKVPVYRIIIPVIYIVFVSGLSFVEKNNIYLIILLEMLIRIFYQRIVLNQTEQLDTDFYIKNYGISIILAYIITKGFIIKVDSVFLTPEELRVGIWFVIIFFLYKMLNNSILVSLEKKETKITLTNEMIVTRYAKFKNNYYDVIKGRNKQINYLVYAIMIWESYHRSSFLRNLDRLIYRFTGRVMKFGIMQIESARELTDEESIKLALKDLLALEKEISNNKKIKKANLTKEILNKYINDNSKVEEILAINNTLLQFDQR